MRLHTPAWWVAGVALLVSVAGAAGQGSFQNLDFESATLVPIPGDPYGRVRFAPAFPGWTGSVGGLGQTAALYDAAFLDSSGVSIINRGWSGPIPNSGGVISGSFTALLQAGVTIPVGTPADTTPIANGTGP
jgi:hypothetical protein